MTELADVAVDYKIASPGSQSIIGSNSINTAGDLYLINFNSVSRDRNRRNKRLFDMGASLFFCLSWLFLFPFFKEYRKNIGNAIKVLFSTRSWVGYCEGPAISGLPSLKKGVFNPCSQIPDASLETKENQNMEYARDYRIYNDFSVFWRNVFNHSAPE